MTDQPTENYTVYITKFNENNKERLTVTEKGITLRGITITHSHEQDCCEDVHVDWEYLNHYNNLAKDIDKLDPTELEIKGVPGMGILLILKQNKYYFEDSLKLFVPAYNMQNSYYSDDLSLAIKQNLNTTMIDIGNYKENKYT